MRRRASILALATSLLLAGCGKDPETQTDAELGLNAQQAHGRRVYKIYCASCHNAYSSKSLKSFSLKGLYKREYLPSGLIANDQFVTQAITRGRKMMPPIPVTQDDLQDLIVYLHTL